MASIRRRLLVASMRSRNEGGNEHIIDINNYLTIEALEDALIASLSVNVCEYCVDGDGNWKTLVAGAVTESINIGQILSFRGNLTPNGTNGIGTFTISKKCNLKGNCMSMLFGDSAANHYSLSGKNYAFYGLFKNCTNVVNVSSNFLPATELADSCYHSMFRGCTSLTQAPKLPATTLAVYCYYYMFYGCSSLNHIKMLATDILGGSYLYNWVRGVASSGTFIKNPDATWEVYGNSGIPNGWTVKMDGEEDSGSMIEFPLNLDFDTCHETEDGVVCRRGADELSIALYEYLAQTALSNGDALPTGGYALTGEDLQNLGIELSIYHDNVLAIDYEDENSYLVLYTIDYGGCILTKAGILTNSI